MAIAFKKVSKRNPQQPTEAGKIYPQTVTMGNHLTLPEVAHRMKERSSLSYGDIQNVLTNFVEVVRTMLYDGQSVRIQDFGCFSLSAHCEGSERKEDCGVRNIKSVHIRFRPAASLKPNLNSKHPAEQLRFYEVKAGRAARPRGGA